MTGLLGSILALTALALAPCVHAKESSVALAVKCRDQGGNACVELDNRCDKKDSESCYSLGQIRVNQRDNTEAMRLFRASCRYGRKQVCEALESVSREREERDQALAEYQSQLEAEQRAQDADYTKLRLQQQFMMNNIRSNQETNQGIVNSLQGLADFENRRR